ncbi:hypothetical protein NHX12_030325 [Muraenolepis orangiensis]|uniref:Colony stimulating factor 1 n=1 Tax=Muraenolepis orangiensis TaxID=630683 RepID=A0A9Q0E9X9_9TELE|nr:hypothetical protein NHX12_030325 [Muraenolepis orangiensis]
MNTYHLELTAKARHVCFLLPLCMSLVWGGVPGPCRHSVTKDHLLGLRRLIDNQLENGCTIVYSFTERQSLSKVCYVKAAFSQILELLNTHFNYAKHSDNRKYVTNLKRVLYNLYSQRCIPQINEEIEDIPVRFNKVLRSSPKEALKKAKAVIEMYVVLLQQRASPVDWSCHHEYAAVEEEQPASTTAMDAVTPGPSFPKATTMSYPVAHSWSTLKQPEPNQTTTAPPSNTPHPPQLGQSPSDTTLSTGTIDKDALPASCARTAATSDSPPFEKRESWDVPATVLDIAYKTDGQDGDFMDSSIGSGSEDATTDTYVLSEHIAVTPALFLANVAQPDILLTFSSIAPTALPTVLGKRILDAKNSEVQHQYDTVYLGHEEVLRRDYYESKTTKGVHRVTPKSTVVNLRRPKMDRSIVDDRALKRRERYSKKSRIIPRDLRARARAPSESDNTRTALNDRSRAGDTRLLFLSESQVMVQTVSPRAVLSGGMLLVVLLCFLASNRRVGRSSNWSSVVDKPRLNMDSINIMHRC